ncbi:MAG: site-specific DNA-methyltransferase [Syntrophomonas sp.]|nr:site-specific DNA-methyltransferase [Syntrophomonas sp.]
MDKLDGKTMDLVQHNIDELKKLFPEALTEGKIDFDRLRLLLGDEVDTGKEKYEFTWPGKSDCIRLAQQQSTGTLRPDKESSKNWDTTQNLYIEGDNLEVLRLLQKVYHRKVKMIYIDPPYNTGNDFIYNDDFKDNVKNYKKKTEQSMKANPATSGRYHSDWLSMMYPRLRLAKNLLKDDGVIFISIDDNEVHNLRKICDEIFGQENCVTQISWQSRQSVQNDTDISVNHEHILVYAKCRRETERRLKESNANKWYNMPGFAAYPLPLDINRFSNPDNDPRGLWKADPFDAPNIRENLTYAIINPNTGEEYWPPRGRCWRTDENNFKRLLSESRIIFGRTGESRPQLKVFYEEKKAFGSIETSWFDGEKYGTTTHGTKELQDLFGVAIFSNPKPTKLIKSLLLISTFIDNDDIVLDFFSGSSTTAHAVMHLNAEDNGTRKFIVVQLPEQCDENSEAYKAGFTNICEIGKERIRRAGEKIKEEYKDKEGIENLDTGFKVFRLDTSNLKAWDPDVEELEDTLNGMVDPIKEDRTQEDMLYEIMLKYGIDLTMPLEEIQIAGKTAYSLGLGYMIVCLEDGLTLDFIEAIGAMKQSGQEIARVVSRDSGFADDNVKTNAVQLFKKFGIEDFRTI